MDHHEERESMTTLGADRGTYLMPGGERFPLSEQVTAISLVEFLADRGCP